MPNKRRLMRFNLKILLVAVTALALWLGWATTSVRKQAAAIAKITNAGGVVRYDAPLQGAALTISKFVGEDFFRTVAIVRAEGAQFDNSITESIATLTETGSLSLRNAKINDAGLKRLTVLDELKRMDLMHTRVTDACIPSLLAMGRLKYVNLEGTKVTIEGTEELRALRPELEIQHHFLD